MTRPAADEKLMMPGGPLAPADSAGRDNMRQLITLRWLAVAGQLATVLVVHFGMGVRLPLAPMLCVIALLVFLNLVSTAGLHARRAITNGELVLALLLDTAALTALLYFSGGATNPFISLFLVQVVLGAVLLESWSSWLIAAVTSACFLFLVWAYQPLVLPERFSQGLFDLYIIGAVLCFVLVAVLLVRFVTRINANLRARDARLAHMRQEAAEEDHIVRMGLLASGAAHELGTPLASLSVILNDWKHTPRLVRNPEIAEEIDDMLAAVGRCKAIVTGILLSAGEARGEHPSVTSVAAFLDNLVEEWRESHATPLAYDNRFGEDVAIVSDTALKQVISNVLDNAAEASGDTVHLSAERSDGALVLRVRDHGPGFAPEMLEKLGKPYQSSKGRLGGGLGLFLVVNVMRKLGGSVEARNHEGGGAVVTLTLPLSALELTRTTDHGH